MQPKSNSRIARINLLMAIPSLVLLIEASARADELAALGTLPGGAEVVEGLTFTFAPGEGLSWHFHPADEYAVILSGDLTEDRGCGLETRVFGVGDAFHEPPGVVHMVKNNGSVDFHGFASGVLPICFTDFNDAIAVAGPHCSGEGSCRCRVPTCDELALCTLNEDTGLWECPDELIQPCESVGSQRVGHK